jgi:thiol:disulfide interchange protein DsbD
VEGAEDSGEPRVAARLVVHPDRTASRVRVGVQLRLDPGWHLYWRNPGDTGLATRIAWTGGTAEELSWPAPTAFREADGEITTFGYAGEVLLTSWLTLAPERRELGATVDVLVCRSSCIPAKLALAAPLAAEPAREAMALRGLFAAHDASLPREASSLGVRLSLERSGDPREALLRVAPCADRPDCRALAVDDGPVFFSAVQADAVRDVAAHGESGGLSILVRSDGDALPARLEGVLALRDGAGVLRPIAVDLPTASASAPAVEAKPSLSLAQLVATLGLGLLGGLILNLMPCVLPVLAMKVFALSELAGQGRREALGHGVAYTLGILLSMLALASVALALRAAGHAVGWGFQFQEPAFVAVISALLVGFALNLFGVFEIGFVGGGLASLGAEATGARRSFFEGLLAVALATPCSAPFLGTALGLAFASPAPVIVATFTAVGLGLAAPFLMISAAPQLARFLPRSGAWMGELRAALGFALLGSVVWLLFVLGRSAGADAVVALLAVLLCGAAVAFVYGRLQHAEVRGLSAGAALAVSLLLLVGMNWVRVDAPAKPAEHADAWSERAVAEALAAGHPTLAYFTADWCLTCKLNERTALETDAVRAELAKRGFRVLRGDWTLRDEAIRAELARHGKAGVPLYLVYSPGAPGAPEILPELLTEARLLDALRRAAR